ncbi:MAG: hypothetical protein QE269_13685 [Fimbriimonas sp.]|nr:hypothetical protein [Fimbriimonas sp.]
MSSQPTFESIVRIALRQCADWQEVPVTESEDIWISDSRIWIRLSFEWRERELLGLCADTDGIATIRNAVSHGTFVEGLLAFNLPSVAFVFPKALDSLIAFELTNPERCVEKLVRLLGLISSTDDRELEKCYMVAHERQQEAYRNSN